MSAALRLPHVDENQLTGLEDRLEEFSQLSLDFLVLLAGSTIIATLGLFQNSPAVIIGAMIIAPLMRPLTGLPLATLTADITLLIAALRTLIVGTSFGVVISFVIAWLLQSIALSPEILNRTHPNLLDLGVAIFAGAIGAYCQTTEELSDTIAGVAVAVALVPPLSVIGIGLALGLPEVWSGASLLYATNLIGITFAGSVVFFLKGYTPAKQAKKGLIFSTTVVALLVVPLALSMHELVLENVLSTSIERILREKTNTFKNVHLRSVEVKRFRKPTTVLATVLATDEPISSNQVKLVQDFLTAQTNTPIEFRLRIIPSKEITAIDVTSQTAEEKKFQLPDELPTFNITPQAQQNPPTTEESPPEVPPTPLERVNAPDATH